MEKSFSFSFSFCFASVPIKYLFLVLAIAVVATSKLQSIPLKISPWPSSVGSTTYYAIDGKQNTTWIAASCLGGSWRGLPEFNLLFNSANFSSGSCDAKLASALDNNVYTAGSSGFSHGEPRSWATFLFRNGAQNVISVYLKGIWPVSCRLSAIVGAISGSGRQTILITTLSPANNYAEYNIALNLTAKVFGFYFEATSVDGIMRGYCYSGVGDCKTITITEIAALGQPCYEQLVIDLGSPKNIQQVNADFQSITGGQLLISMDGSNYQNITNLKNYIYWGPKSIPIRNATAQYVKMVFLPDPINISYKVSVNGISILGDQSLVSTCPNKCSGHGLCSTMCTCSSGFSGADCSIPSCSPPCSNGGQCVNGKCVCPSGFGGLSCSTSICPNNCFGQGTCVRGVCVCWAGYAGGDCRHNTFTAVSGANTTVIQLLDYRIILGNKTFASPAAVTKYYANETAAAKKIRCAAATPYVCPDKSCAISRGACALKQKPFKLADWTSSQYDAAPLSPAAVTTSSNTASAAQVVDGNQNSFWQSSQCYPTGYMQYREVNILNGVCAVAGRCTISGVASTATSVVGTALTDLNTNTAASTSGSTGSRWIQISLVPARTLVAVSLKTNTAVSVVGIPQVSGPAVPLGSVSTSYSFININLLGNTTAGSTLFKAIRIQANSSFSVFEVSARSAPCFEHATVDLGSVQPITALTIRHWAGSLQTAVYTTYESSLDGVAWNVITGGPVSVPSSLMGPLDVDLNPPVSTRYVRVRHVLQERVTANLYVWEIQAWGVGGKYGASPAVVANPVSFRDLLGVNGIWSWGGQGWSNLAHDGWGPKRVSKMSSHARNYHNWNWDVTDPDIVPNFEAMACGKGTQANWWLSWDWEYAGWNAAGLEVDACIQFTSSMFPQSAFNDPFRAGYNYGYVFAKHFGRNGGTGLVATIEVGNEPWIVGVGYSSATFYSQVLLGMAQGAKAADPTMRVLPASFGSMSDWQARVNATHLKYLDALNIHAYSWVQTPLGTTGIHPEHNMSTIHSVNSMLRFRDVNAPGVPVYLTEWGWDSAGGGEGCGPPAQLAGGGNFSQCVSELGQAVYAVRGALVLARKGLSRLTWYFYGNQLETVQTWQQAKGLFARSGLTSSSATGFANKLSMKFLEDFVSLVGSTSFLGVIREDSAAYVYILGNATSKVATHVVAWRPVSVDDLQAATVQVTYSANPTGAWIFSTNGIVPATIPTVTGSTWQLSVSNFPLVVEVTTPTPCQPACLNGGTCHDGTCICKLGFQGVACANRTCEQNCWQRGTCRADGSCACDLYLTSAGSGEYQRCRPENFLYAGACRDNPAKFDAASSCELSQCPNNCNGHGTCTAQGCVCDVGWFGANCQYAPCPFNCRSHGVCGANSTCACRPGFVGPDCRWPRSKSSTSGSLQASQCPPATPVQCPDKSCAISRGACALGQKPFKLADWTSSQYDAAPLSPAAVTTSSNTASAAQVVDGNQNSFWQSSQCFPTGYMQYREVNILSGVCGVAGRCTISGVASTATSVVGTALTDMDLTTTASTVGNGASWMQISLASPSSLVAVSIRAASPVWLVGITQATNARIALGSTTTAYTTTNFNLLGNTTAGSTLFKAIRVEANSSFSVFEVSARSAACFEHATVDFGSVQPITALTIRHWAGSLQTAVYTTYESSLDGVAWNVITGGPVSVPSSLMGALDVDLNPPVSTRYVRVRHVLQERVSVSVYVWEIQAWGVGGKYGASPAVVANPVSFRDLLGVNGIWGWGHNSFSSSLPASQGPRRFSGMGSHARNYHNWNWDVSTPMEIPPFNRMVAPGSTDFGVIPGHSSLLEQDWLNWDNEYTSWKAGGLNVEVSIQFTTDMFSQDLFTDPYRAGYGYGFAFASHFGSKNGTGDVDTIEVGNEPWISGMGYPSAAFYSQVLLGMAQGAKAADPTMRVLPASFGSMSDWQARVNATHLKYLDALNIHAYSWVQTPLGTTGIHPEHNMSTIHSVNSMLRFRDVNAPGVPVYLTEWGWDSAGGGEGCGPPAQLAGGGNFSQCVSELGQAVYAVRGALVLARKGLSRLTWYFYGNQLETVQTWQEAKGLFARSGLTSSSATGFKTKLALPTLGQFVSLVGSTSFLGVIREDSAAYVYILGNATSKVATHVVAWRPVDIAVTSAINVSFPCAYAVTASYLVPNATSAHAAFPVRNLGTWKLRISAIPTILRLVPQAFSAAPSAAPTNVPAASPTSSPTPLPSASPILQSSRAPSVLPSVMPSAIPSAFLNPPTLKPSANPSLLPVASVTSPPSTLPSTPPAAISSQLPLQSTTREPTAVPSIPPVTPPTAIRSQLPLQSTSREPTAVPSIPPVTPPTAIPSQLPLQSTSREPTAAPSVQPTRLPSQPTIKPTPSPTATLSKSPSVEPTVRPTAVPSPAPTRPPVADPSPMPSIAPSSVPSRSPSTSPSSRPTVGPSPLPSRTPSTGPTVKPSVEPSPVPSKTPSTPPSAKPSPAPSVAATRIPSPAPSRNPSRRPTSKPV